MPDAWDRINDEDFKSWLLEDMTVEEYNELGPVDRRTLRTQFQQTPQQHWHLVEGSIKRQKTHAGARQMLFKFASDNSGFYAEGMNANTAFRAKGCGTSQDQRILAFSVIFETLTGATQFMNAFVSYVISEDHVCFCDETGKEAKRPGLRKISPPQENSTEPVLLADYVGREVGALPPVDSPVLEIAFDSRSFLSAGLSENATILSQTNPVFKYQRVENDSIFSIAEPESAHIYPSAKCVGPFEWLDDKDYNRLALSRDLHVNFDGTGRGRGKRRKTAQTMTFKPVRPVEGYKRVGAPNGAVTFYEIPLEIVTNDKQRVDGFIIRLQKSVALLPSPSDDHFWTIAGADLKIYYPTDRMVTLETEAMRQSDGTLKPVLVTKVPGIEDLSTCWSSRGFTLKAAEILEKCLMWNYNAALAVWSQSG